MTEHLRDRACCKPLMEQQLACMSRLCRFLWHCTLHVSLVEHRLLLQASSRVVMKCLLSLVAACRLALSPLQQEWVEALSSFPCSTSSSTSVSTPSACSCGFQFFGCVGALKLHKEHVTHPLLTACDPDYFHAARCGCHGGHTRRRKWWLREAPSRALQSRCTQGTTTSSCSEVFSDAWNPNIDCSVAPGVKGAMALSQAVTAGSVAAGPPVALHKKHSRSTVIESLCEPSLLKRRCPVRQVSKEPWRCRRL